MPAKRKSSKPARAKTKARVNPLAEMIDAGVVECRGDKIVSANVPAAKLLGVRRAGDLVGRALTDFLAIEGRLPTAVVKAKAPRRTAVAPKNGHPHDVMVTGRRVSANDVIVVLQPAPLELPVAAPAAALPPPATGMSELSRQILASASDAIVAVDLEGKVTSANPAAAELFNRDVSSMAGIPVDRLFMQVDGGPAPVKSQIASGPYHVEIDAWLLRTDGSTFEAVYLIAPLSEGKTRRGAVVTVRDVTEIKRIQSEQRIAAAVFQHSSEGLLVADSRLRVTRANPAFKRIAGLVNESVAGRQLADVLRIDPKTIRDVTATLERSPQAEWEQWVGDGASARKAWRIGLSVVRDDNGKPQQYAAAVSDITARKLQEEKIVFQANYDQLTGLPNRTLFKDRLQRLVLEGRRAKTSVGMMFIDLDGFKAVNDSLGHDAGDILLKATAERLLNCVREADTVARLGGDEFTVIMPLLDSLEGAAVVAQRILNSLMQPFDLKGQEGRVSASIGISIFPAQAGDAQQLLHNADVAMYHAKRQGKANFQIWKPDFEADAETRY